MLDTEKILEKKIKERKNYILKSEYFKKKEELKEEEEEKNPKIYN